MSLTERKEKERLTRKNDIINAAEKVFFHKGFEYATMDDIAKEAEFTKKTLYSYFKSKDELYYEIMLRGFKALNDMNGRVLSENSNKSELEKIRILAKTFIHFSYEYTGYFKAIVDYENKEFDFQADSGNSLVKECYIAGEYSFELLKSFVVNGIKKGEISRENDPITTCLVLWSCISGFIGLFNKKEKYINAYYNKNASEIMEDGLKIILNSIKE
jgi:AcrR family transcriptional regulator